MQQTIDPPSSQCTVCRASTIRAGTQVVVPPKLLYVSSDAFLATLSPSRARQRASPRCFSAHHKPKDCRRAVIDRRACLSLPFKKIQIIHCILNYLTDYKNPRRVTKKHFYSTLKESKYIFQLEEDTPIKRFGCSKLMRYMLVKKNLPFREHNETTDYIWSFFNAL